MASIFDVAKYILHEKGAMDTQKLQKLCYYCQAWSLARDGKELFPEEFEDWENGAVCRELFYTHQGMRTINEQTLDRGDAKALLTTEIILIGTILRSYGDYTSEMLKEKNHKEAPWKVTRGDLPADAKDNKIIDKEMMRRYYANLDRLSEISKLEPNWDGEDGKTFSADFLKLVNGILNQIPIQPEEVEGAGNGSIIFEYGSIRFGNRYMAFEISPDGVVKAYFRDEDNNRTEDTIGINEINEWVSRF